MTLKILLTPGAGEDLEALIPPCNANRNVKEYVSLKSCSAVSYKVKYTLAIRLGILFLGIYRSEIETYVHTKTCK